MDTLYYDGRCPLCMHEVRLLQRLGDSQLVLLDLHSIADIPGQPSRLLKLTSLHLQTATGDWLTGLDATVQAWSHTRWGWLARILRWPLVGWIADHCYQWWARRRYQSLYGCGDCRED
jgi:predicted DCC family thiol-disulfide oxidoreductase YuxK